MITTCNTSPEMAAKLIPTYNLWIEPWIGVLNKDGILERVGIRECLVRAHELHEFADQSPLVIASLQRLIAAIAQDIFQPQSVADLAELLRGNHFDRNAIDQFGTEYFDRFDLFSETAPFMQTADIPLIPEKGLKTKTVAYLFPEEPSAINVNHFRHNYDSDYQFSPATAAAGLITQPAFATSGGRSFRPSINGVPPLYVLPSGETLFQTTALSIITPSYQPRVATQNDRPAWRKKPFIGKSVEVLSVGYLESLTFPARRVRLFPERSAGHCSRSGEWCDVLVRKLVFEMGHSRPRDSEIWFDPFAAYWIPPTKDTPESIRPEEGKLTWREYGNLFHTSIPDAEQFKSGVVRPPAVVRQLADLQESGISRIEPWRCRCIGMRASRAKVYSWSDELLQVPPELLSDPAGQFDITFAIERAESIKRTLEVIHFRHFSGRRDKRRNNPLANIGERWKRLPSSEKRDAHHQGLLNMIDEFWILLADPFRNFVLLAAVANQREEALRQWSQNVLNIGEQVLSNAIDSGGRHSENICWAAVALNEFRGVRAKKAKEWLA